MKLNICRVLLVALIFISIVSEVWSQTFPPGITVSIGPDNAGGWPCRSDRDITASFIFDGTLYYSPASFDPENPPSLRRNLSLPNVNLVRRASSSCLSDGPVFFPVSATISTDNLRFLPTDFVVNIREHVDIPGISSYDIQGRNWNTELRDHVDNPLNDNPTYFVDYLKPYKNPLSIEYSTGSDDDPWNPTREFGAFAMSLIIPQIATFTTYADPGRTEHINRFCADAPIYGDTYYKTNPLTGVRIQWQTWYSGQFSHEGIITTSSDNKGNVVINPSRPDITGITTMYVRTRIVGDRLPIRSVWSATQEITMYPKVKVNMDGIDPAAVLTTEASLLEKSNDNSFQIKHASCAGRNDGKIIINTLKNMQRYSISVKNISNGDVMNYKIFRDPAVSNPIVLPDSAIRYPAHANNTLFRFEAGLYEMSIQYLNADGSPFGCAFPQEFTVKQPPILQANISKVKYHEFNVSCHGNADGIIKIEPQGGIGPFNFTLKGYAAGNEVVSQTAAAAGHYNFSGLAPFSGDSIDYHLTFTDVLGCPARNLANGTNLYTKEYHTTPSSSEGKPLRLKVPPPISIQEYDADFVRLHNYNIRCFGWKDSTQVTVTGGTKRFAVWLDGNGLSNYQRRDSVNQEIDYPIFTTLAAGTYTIHAVDRNGCTALKDFIFTQPGKITLEESAVTQLTCFGNNSGAIKVNGLGGVPLPGGQRYKYSLMQTSPPLTITKKGEAVTFTDLRNGIYTVTISDTSSCQLSYNFTLTQPSMLGTAIDANEITCYGDGSGRAEAIVTGGTAPYTLQWLDAGKALITSVPLAHPGDHHTLENQHGGQYYTKLIDAHHCELEKPFIISQPPSPLVINAMADETRHVSCNGASDGKVTLTVAGGWTLSPYEIGRSKDNLKPNAFAFTALDAGVQRFYVRDFEGCIDSVDVTLQEPEELEAKGIDVKAVSCFGNNDGSFAPQITGGTVPYEINMNASGWTSADPINELVEGNYTLQARDANGCLSDFNVIIPTPAVLDVGLISSGDTQCGESNGHATISISGGNTPYSIRWSLDDQPVTGTLTATSLPSGVYKVMITDTKNCQTSMNVGISDSDAATITVVDVTPITCFGDSDGTASITLTGGILPYTEILWTMGQTGLKATGLTASDHVVSVKDQAGCISTKQINIPGPDPLLATFKDVINPHCFGDDNGSVRVEASGGTAPYSYLWSNTSNSSDHMKDAGAGILSVGITDVNGCVLDTQYDLQQPPEVEVDLRGEAFFCTGQTVKLDAGNPGATYQWASTIGATSAARVFEATQTGTYTVTVTDERGCIGTGSRDLTFDSDILRADFISTSEAVAGDTVVLINVSFPLPDSSYWTLPEGVTVIEASYFIQYIIFPDSGIYTITLSATKGECFDQIQDNIIIIGRKVKDNDDNGGRKASLITAFTIHPNPSSGKFKISVQLRETAPIEIKIFSYTGGNPWAAYQDADKEYYEIEAEMNAPPGVYAIVLEAGNEKMVKRFIIY